MRDQVIKQCKYKYSDADITIHIEKGNVELTQVSRLDHGMFIQQKPGCYENSKEIDTA